MGESNIPVYNKPVRIHGEAGSVSARLVFETRAKCQDSVARCKDDGISCEIDRLFCSAKTTFSVRQSKSIEDREIGKQFAPLWRVLAEQLKILFPDGDDEGAFIVPALDTRSQVLGVKDRRNGVGKPVFKLVPLGSGLLFVLVAPDLRVPGVSGEVLQRVISQASTANVCWPVLRLSGRCACFRDLPFRWVLHLALSLTRRVIVHDATP